MKKRSYLFLLIITVLFLVCVAFLLYYRHSTPIYLTDIENLSTENNSVIVDGKINVNTASAENLILLPNIGKTLATRIVQYREENGPYACIEDLNNVKGIGKTTLDAIQNYICFGE